MPMKCEELSDGKVLGKDSLILRENYKKRQEINKEGEKRHKEKQI